jgi:hypothetical protein
MDIPRPDIRRAEPPLTERALCAWLGSAAAGERITYHRGFLVRETSPLTRLLPDPERLALMRVANRAWVLAETGLAHLVQRRHGDDDYSYMLVARRRPPRARPSVLPALLAKAA